MLQRWLFIFLGVLILSLAPSFLSVRYLNLLTEVLILGLFSMSINLIMGYTGMVSFGQAAYFGVGAYITAFILLHSNLSLLVAALGGALGGALIAVPIGYICTRAREIAFAMLTLGFGQLIYTIVYQWWRSFTGGSDGLTGVPRSKAWFGLIDLNSNIAFYYFVLIIVLLSILFFVQIIKSPFGKILHGIRENENKIETLGINIRKFKLISFVIAAFFAGMAGSLYCALNGFASPTYNFWAYSGNCILMAVLGGLGTILGPVVGATIFTLVQELLSSYTDDYLIFVGIIFILAVLFFPSGVVGSFSFLSRKKQEY